MRVPRMGEGQERTKSRKRVQKRPRKCTAFECRTIVCDCVQVNKGCCFFRCFWGHVTSFKKSG